jgi:hypothetical protein
MDTNPETTTLGPRMRKYFEFMKTNRYRLEKEIGMYMMYSFIENHCPQEPNIYDETEHRRIMKNLFDNFDDLPYHKYAYLLKRDFLKEGKTLTYAPSVYPTVVKTIAIALSRANDKVGEGNYTDLTIKSSDLEE